MEPKQHYVVGFVFDLAGRRVLLVKKNKPEWQRNKMNGIGGKLEPDELPVAGMMREFLEETGVLIPELLWQKVCLLDGEWGALYVFSAFIPNIEAAVTIERDGEFIAAFQLDDLPLSCIPNVRWLIPMALSLTRGETCRWFRISELNE